MNTEHLDRIRYAPLRERVTSAQEAARWIEDGMTVGMSGFTRAGDVKLVPGALAERAPASAEDHAADRRLARQRHG